MSERSPEKKPITPGRFILWSVVVVAIGIAAYLVTYNLLLQ